ncbi:hypothetical protein MSAN_01914500 [Mycena sanguinolenta]|uniref:Uncharacterized protein n=1 Tax=Mycena sanguinolenta TaxID=230812 RepID=A0A8H7CQB2_9AGAR|nr:hypothetical protein MSAN_01914500 [Mycena sanguinolenta]
MQDAVSELTRLTQSIGVDDVLDDEDREAFQRLSDTTAKLYFAPPGMLFNPHASFWVVYEGERRGIYGTWGMSNAVTSGYAGNSHRKIRGWQAAVQALTQHLWDLGFRAEEPSLLSTPSPSTTSRQPPSSRATPSHSSHAQPAALSAASARVVNASRNNPSRTHPASPATLSRIVNASRNTSPRGVNTLRDTSPSRVINTSRTHPTSPATLSRIVDASRDTSPSRVISTSRKNTSCTQPTHALITPIPVPLPSYVHDTSITEALVPQEPRWYVVASDSEIAVFKDRDAAQRRAVEHQDMRRLDSYCSTDGLGSLLDAVEGWVWDHAD